jgi:hypothetical protein
MRRKSPSCDVRRGATLTVGLAMSLATRRFRRELQPRDGFLLVA